jgi:hypothetical protein
MKRTAFFLGCFLFLLPSLSSADQKEYVQHLVSRGKFYDAITETYRLYFFSSSLDKNANARMDLDLSRIYLAGERFGLARYHSQRAIQTLEDNASLKEGYRICALAFERENDLANAFHIWNTCGTLFPDSGAYAKACEMAIKLSRESDTLELLSKIRSRPEGISFAYLGLLEKKSRESASVPRRSEKLAFLFSFVPGLPQIYCGKTVEGLIAFFVQTGAGFLTWERWHSDDKVTSVILGLTTFTWYSYNFTRSQDDCQEFNRKSWLKFRSSFSLPVDF